MSRLGVVVMMLALVSIVGGCSQGSSSAAPAHVFSAHLAWSGIAANGLRIVVEPLVEPLVETTHVKPAIASEDHLLRTTFGIKDGEQLLRVSLYPAEESGLPAKRGSVQVAADVYSPLTAMPEGLSVQGRLMWHSIVTGGREIVAPQGELQHWSYLLVATAPALPNPQDKMFWQSEALRVELHSQGWSEAERQQFLDVTSPVENE